MVKIAQALFDLDSESILLEGAACRRFSILYYGWLFLEF